MTKTEEIKNFINKILIPNISDVESPCKWELYYIGHDYLTLVNYSNENDVDYEDQISHVRKLCIIFNTDGSWIIKSDANINYVKGEFNVKYRWFDQNASYFYALYQLMNHGIDNTLLKRLSKLFKELNEEKLLFSELDKNN